MAGLIREAGSPSRCTTGPASPNRTGHDPLKCLIFMILVGNPRYEREIYHDHEAALPGQPVGDGGRARPGATLRVTRLGRIYSVAVTHGHDVA
jgi:hypothetical protein